MFFVKHHANHSAKSASSYFRKPSGGSTTSLKGTGASIPVVEKDRAPAFGSGRPTIDQACFSLEMRLQSRFSEPIPEIWQPESWWMVFCKAFPSVHYLQFPFARAKQLVCFDSTWCIALWKNNTGRDKRWVFLLFFGLITLNLLPSKFQAMYSRLTPMQCTKAWFGATGSS